MKIAIDVNNKIYQFTLKLHIDDVSNEMFDRLCKAGCADSIYYTTYYGQCLDFYRKAPSLEDAIFEAIVGVNKAGVRATYLGTF